MTTTPRPWTVLPHDPLLQLDDDLWCVRAPLPGLPATVDVGRRMSIARAADGALVFFNAVPVDDATLAAISALGHPSVLVVPVPAHRIDVHAFQAKLGVRVVASAVARPSVAERVVVDGGPELLPPGIEALPIDGCSHGELALVVGGARKSVLFGDVVQNIPPTAHWSMRALRWTGDGPRTNWPWRALFMNDRAAVQRTLLDVAERPGLARIVPSHGDVLDHDAASSLRSAATRL